METEEECPILFEPKQIKVWFQKSQALVIMRYTTIT
ncbi:hypothetical protein COLO4_13775 [Corchorus olitorius]|uniref:Uncharacterized protein n=1 Tax=Corchorus olitorius TaxID=93759 RepID=A0A1R3JUX8_9ROSI|nr:hypothetical protein COLO4_13775 [Corchorus olitorius]